MMESENVERRRARRIGLQAPLVIRRIGAVGPEPFKEQVTENIGLAGVYFETQDEQPYAVNEVVMTSVSIPASQRRDFPFTRLAGRSRVVRVEALPQQPLDRRRRFGVALEFGEDVTALTATPSRS